MPDANPLAAQVREYFETRLPAMLARLEAWTVCESPTTEPAAVNALRREVAAAFIAAGAKQQFHADGTADAALELTVQGGTEVKQGELLVLGHLDTVYPLGTLARQPFRIDAGCAYGPGVLDMKAGLISALFALQALHALSLAPRRRLRLLFTSDEETGSRTSRPLIEAAAKGAAAVLVLEPGAGPAGALKTARKGIADFRLRAHGRAAHAGVDFEQGASAVVELARQITALAAWSDPARGLTVNPGVVRGGSRVNVVAAEAEAELELRAWRLSDLQEAEQRLAALRPLDRRVRLEVEGRINRPPLERTDAIAALFLLARDCGRELGLDLAESATGGGSDGNFTAALGIPTLDGLGAAGEGAHSPGEYIRLDTWPLRAALLALLFARV